MRIPHQAAKRLDFYREVCDACLLSRQNRTEQYARWRRYYLYGTSGDVEEGPSPWNKIYSHLDTVTSFLYARDSTRFAASLGAKAPRTDRVRTGALAKRTMEEWQDCNADGIMEMSITWALVYNTTIVKNIRRGGAVYPFMVDPSCFGVYREDTPMLDRQEAFVHIYYITKSELRKRLSMHPNREDILRSVEEAYAKKDTASNTPAILDRVVLTSTAQNGIGMANVIGEANINTAIAADTVAVLAVPLIEMQEMWVWNDAIDDYQVVTMASGTALIYDRQNIFMPRSDEWEGEHGFVQVCPNPLPDYFWGMSEVERLAPIQDKRNARMAGIEKLEQKQIDPPTAWTGMGLSEDKFNGFNTPGAQIAAGDSGTEFKQYIPQIPGNLYASIDRIDAEFDETSGLSNVAQGKGEAGVRSAGHAGKLLTVSSARPKKRGMIIEDSLEREATLVAKCLYMDDTDELHDDHDKEFIIAQMSPHFKIKVDSHSNSPIFMENQQALSDRLLKAKSITRKRYIQMNHPPMEEDLIRDLEEQIIPAEQKTAEKRAQQEQAALAAKAGGGAGGKPNLQAVK